VCFGAKWWLGSAAEIPARQHATRSRIERAAGFTGISCAISSMTQPQSAPFGGTNPPQWTALSAPDPL
jgi:hypothetical protein